MIVELKNICKTFGNHTVLKDFSLQIKGNEFVAIIGESGAGKTIICVTHDEQMAKKADRIIYLQKERG